ncbi:hypothetical protein [Arthrobacter sp. ISL-30]|nr:hypothetical protein [Arthrobacter sp. ISL-30]
MRSLAEKKETSPHVVEASYRAMIDAFIELELEVHRATAQP